MRLTEYRTLRRGVQTNAFPAQADDLRPLEERLYHDLTTTGVFDDVEVGTTDDVDHLLIALCRFRPELHQEDVAQLLERLWEDRLRYGFWAAHATLVDKEQVELQGATRAGVHGHYATVHIVAQRATVPAQRVASG
jgi:hypothetical protein